MAEAARPREIKLFEMLWLAGIAIDLATSLRFYTQPQSGDMADARIGGMLGIGITVLLVLAVSRQAIRLARIALTVWLLFGLCLVGGGMILLGRSFAQTFTTIGFVTIAATTGLKLVALYFLWTEAASAWLAKEG